MNKKTKDSLKKILTLKQRQEILLKKGHKVADISKTRKQISQKMDNLVALPVKMQEFRNEISVIKSAKKRDHSVVDTNIQIAANWGTFQKMKLDRLSSATRMNKTMVIRKRKKIDKIRRNKETITEYWDRKKQEVSFPALV